MAREDPSAGILRSAAHRRGNWQASRQSGCRGRGASLHHVCKPHARCLPGARREALSVVWLGVAHTGGCGLGVRVRRGGHGTPTVSPRIAPGDDGHCDAGNRRADGPGSYRAAHGPSARPERAGDGGGGGDVVKRPTLGRDGRRVRTGDCDERERHGHDHGYIGLGVRERGGYRGASGRCSDVGAASGHPAGRRHPTPICGSVGRERERGRRGGVLMDIE